MKFAVESFSNFRYEFLDLVRLHHKEIKWDGLPLSIDSEAYNGPHTCFTGRVDGKLKAYAIFVCRHHPHSKNVYTAFNDMIFVHPDHRRHSLQFLSFVEKRLVKMGVENITYSVSPKRDWSPVLKRKGFEQTEQVWMRRLA